MLLCFVELLTWLIGPKGDEVDTRTGGQEDEGRTKVREEEAGIYRTTVLPILLSTYFSIIAFRL